MIVVKLGGSLYQSTELKHWLTSLESLAKQHSIVIVPGGGPFADNVRNAQAIYHFDESAAHHMALLAMAQFGLLLSGLSPTCQCFRYQDFRHESNGLSVWLPDESLLSEQDIPHSWDISSDSLSLWLASKLKAERLILVKSCAIPDKFTLSSLSQQAIIDQGFEQLYQSLPVKLQLINLADYPQLDYIVQSLPANRL